MKSSRDKVRRKEVTRALTTASSFLESASLKACDFPIMCQQIPSLFALLWFEFLLLTTESILIHSPIERLVFIFKKVIYMDNIM